MVDRFAAASGACAIGGAGNGAALSEDGVAATEGDGATATVSGARSAGAVNEGISCPVRFAIITASVDSSTAAAAASGQRGRRTMGAASAGRGRASTCRAAAARIAARVAADGRSSSAALASR
jgi:hypothetical protein